MKDHVIICKFIAIWPTKRALIYCIKTRWKSNAHFDMKLGSKGFFTMIFSDLKDKESIKEGGPYFYNLTGIFLKNRVKRYNPNREDFT